MEQVAQKRIAAIDLSGIFRAAWHATEHEEISAAFNRTVSTVTTCVAGFDAVAICVDRPPYKRKAISPEYKAQREKQPETMYEQIRAVEKQLDADGFYLLGSEGYEADDIIACVAAWAGKEGHHLTVFSADKDMLQLVGSDVRVISTATKQEYGSIEDVKARLGVGPSQVPELLALMGDASDNIAGIKGVGLKTAAKWLTDIGPLEFIVKNTDKLPERFAEVVRTNADALLTSLKLCKLMTDAPVLPEVILEPKPRKAGPTTAAVGITDEPGDQEAPPDEPEIIRGHFHTDEELAAMESAKAAPDQPQAEAPKTLTPVEQKWREEQAARREQAAIAPPPIEAKPMPAPEVVAAPTKDPGPRPAPMTTGITAEPSTAMVAWERALEPKGPSQAWQMACSLYESRIFGQFPNPQAVLAIIMSGRSMGLDTVTSLRNFHIVKGKACPHAHLLIGVVKRSPLCEYFQLIETSSKLATYETKRRDSKPVRLTYTIEQAAAAGLLSPSQSGEPSNWIKRPDEMLRKTAGVQLCRVEYADLTMGLYSVEEMQDEAA